MNESNKFKLGLIVNPISGMGGSVGLKGTDGVDILKKAIDLGAEPNALNRTHEFLKELKSIKSKISFITCPNFMGETSLKKLDFEYELIDHPLFGEELSIYDSTNEHTKTAANLLKEVDLILFVGGDGTARDILSVIGKDRPCLGIPAGVKIYSSVFALNPAQAANLVIQFLWDEIPLKENEVLDIDEDAYREGRLVSRLYGYMLTPFAPEFCQASKCGTPDSDLNNQERIAKRIVELLEDNILYLIGPGTTTKAITDILHQEKSVLGVDLLLNKTIVAKDLNEQQILQQIEGKETKVIVSLIGRQGFLFGRGNLQFTPKILRKVGVNNVIIISTKYKLQNIPNQILRIDTRDPQLDEEMRGLYKVFTDYDEIKICEVK